MAATWLCGVVAAWLQGGRAVQAAAWLRGGRAVQVAAWLQGGRAHSIHQVVSVVARCAVPLILVVPDLITAKLRGWVVALCVALLDVVFKQFGWWPGGGATRLDFNSLGGGPLRGAARSHHKFSKQST